MGSAAVEGMNPKVQISYFDPFHLFDGLRSEIGQRLPLTNLHWKSEGGTLKTISSLNVEFFSSTGDEMPQDLILKPFINCVIVSCESVEDYRSKIRPLIRNWLPSQEELYCTNIVVLHSNKEILDSSIFKSVSLIEKFNKDFPSLKTLETKTVYKSNEERDAFWNGLINKLKHYLLEVLEKRINSYEATLKKEEAPNSLVLLHENLLKLYLSFQLTAEASAEIEKLDTLLSNKGFFPVKTGDLQTPVFKQNKFSVNAIRTLIATEELTFFMIQKCILEAQLELYVVSSNDKTSEKKLNDAFHRFLWRLHSSFHTSAYWLQFKFSLYDEFINLDVFENSKSDGWKLILCDLKNEQRECWIQLACSKMSYRVPLMEFDLKLTPKTDPITEETFKTEEVFYKNVVHKTKDLLKEYSSFASKRQRVMDWLSIEIALLYYDRGDYANCMIILQSSYDFYMESHWSVIGSWLLEYYIECIEKCPDITEIDLDGDLVPKSIVLSNSYLNLLTSNSKNPRKWWTEFLNSNINKNDNLIYPLDNLFAVDIIRRVFPVQANSYGIDIFFSRKCDFDDISISSITLLMKSYADEFLEFTVSDVILSSNTSIYTLVSNSIQWCTFELVALEVVIGSTFFKKEFDSLETEDSLCLQPCQSVDSFKVNVAKYVEQVFDKNYLRLRFENTQNVDQFTFNIQSMNQDEIFFANGESSLVVSSFETLRVWFEKKSQSTCKFSIKTTLSFTKCNVQFVETCIHEVDCKLPLDVSVEDVYSKDTLVFDFSLKSLSDEIIFLFDASLTADTDTKYVISDTQTLSEPALLTPTAKLPYHIFFQLSNKSGSFLAADKFNLSVKYLRAQQYFKEVIECMIPTDSNNIIDYSYWQNSVIPSLRFDYRAFELSRKLTVISDFTVTLELLRPIKDLRLKSQITDILKKLESGISIDEASHCERETMLHELIVPVSIPKLTTFYSIQFKQMTRNEELKTGIPSLFEVKVTDLSDTWELSAKSDVPVFTIINCSEWIVGGKRRFEINSKHIIISVNLIPLRRGYLSYPAIEITNTSGDATGEIDYLNSNDKLLVF
ncbi:unnamed protein product [Kluyveromyces dobzhanskii CBS 2104]|uniref:WGS project CCBQ000000000 data, contig 00099 n=1 Tax=Kluyveromyces dobzhanskii CBS 2104 TaxID=1427455 RepID=A0A0A8L465_9SACH|nr:unnamed protein product [Kluyveromyces dobzhanskii CBS 2104]